MNEAIKIDDLAFLKDGDLAIGSVRQVLPSEITIFVENAGDFRVPLSAVDTVHSDKVMLHANRLDETLLAAIRVAHNRETGSAQ
jgi:hypothetical protein